MNMLILRSASRVLLPTALVFSVYLLLRGHNEPGGGFVGGLVASAGLTVHGLAAGRERLLAAMRCSPGVFASIGLVLAVLAGIPALVLGQPFLTHQWHTGPGGLAVGTTLVFDLGVYLAVLGAVTGFVSHYLPER